MFIVNYIALSAKGLGFQTCFFLGSLDLPDFLLKCAYLGFIWTFAQESKFLVLQRVSNVRTLFSIKWRYVCTNSLCFLSILYCSQVIPKDTRSSHQCLVMHWFLIFIAFICKGFLKTSGRMNFLQTFPPYATHFKIKMGGKKKPAYDGINEIMCLCLLIPACFQVVLTWNQDQSDNTKIQNKPNCLRHYTAIGLLFYSLAN